MKLETKLRLVGGVLILMGLVFLSLKNVETSSLYLAVLACAVGYEYLIVRPSVASRERGHDHRSVRE